MLIYKMSISDYKQTIFVLKASTDMVYNEIQAAIYIVGLRIFGYFCISLYQTLSFCLLPTF